MKNNKIPVPIRIKLLTAQIGLVIFVSLVIGISAYFIMHHFLRKSQKGNLTFVAESISKQIYHSIKEKEQILEKIATADVVAAYAEKFEDQLLLKYFDRFMSDFSELSYVNRQGNEMLKVANGEAGENLSDISKTILFEESSWKPNKTISLLSNKSNGASYMEFAFCRQNFFDEFEGVVVGRIPVKEFFKSVREFKFGSEGYAMVTDSKNTILGHPDEDRILEMITITGNQAYSVSSRLEATKSGFGRVEILGVDSFISYVPVEGRNWMVIAVLPYNEFMAAPVALRNTAVLISLIVLVVASIISYIFSTRITEPILELSNKAHLVAGGDFSHGVAVRSNDEIGLLCDSFNRMIANLNESTTSIDNLNYEIDERKKAERRQAHLLEKLESTNEELKEFAYIVSHDLKAPLRGIRSIVTWIAEDYADMLNKDGKEQIDLLVNRTDRMQQLIDGVLQYSRIGRVSEGSTQVDLSKLLPEIIDLLAPLENISITIENELPVIECEQTRISQVFQNLLSNAVKFIDKPSGTIKVGCVEENGFWKFSVSDNGPGIDEKHYEAIFKVFQTLNRRDDVEGTGIGLSVVKKIISLYGGKIWIESKLGEGSTFYFTLPMNMQTPIEEEKESTVQADV